LLHALEDSISPISLQLGKVPRIDQGFLSGVKGGESEFQIGYLRQGQEKTSCYRHGKEAIQEQRKQQERAAPRIDLSSLFAVKREKLRTQGSSLRAKRRSPAAFRREFG